MWIPASTLQRQAVRNDASTDAHGLWFLLCVTSSLRVWCCSSCDCVFLIASLSVPRTRLVCTTLSRPQSMSTSLVSDIQSAINAKDFKALANAVAEAKKSAAELAKWIALGEEAMAKVSPSKTSAAEKVGVKKVAEKTMAETWTFFFMSRDVFLALPLSEGGVPRHQELRKQGKLFERRVSLEEVFTQRLARTSVVFSHRWFEPTHPDPQNVKLLKAQEFVHAQPAVDAVWMDWLSVPQSHGGPPRTEDEEDYFTSTLYNINMLYLGLQVARCSSYSFRFVFVSALPALSLSLVIWTFSCERLNAVISRSSSSTTTSTTGASGPASSAGRRTRWRLPRV